MRTVLVLLVFFVGCSEAPKTIGPFRFQELVNRCLALKGKPTPIYDKTDPTIIFEVQCEVTSG